MSFYVFVGVVAAFWLLSFAAALFALRWNLVLGRSRFRAALVSSCVAVAIAYLGLTRVHLSASKTVNGQTQWSLNSKWFFLVSLLLGVGSLGVTLWNLRKRSTHPTNQPLEPIPREDSLTNSPPS